MDKRPSGIDVEGCLLSVEDGTLVIVVITTYGQLPPIVIPLEAIEYIFRNAANGE